APLRAFRFERAARERDDLALLRERFAEPREKGLEIPHADDVEAAAGARRESGFVFGAIFFERRKLLLHLGQVPLRCADALRAFLLGARGLLLNDVETFGA